MALKEVFLVEFRQDYIEQFQAAISGSGFKLVGTAPEGGAAIKQIKAMPELPEIAIITLSVDTGVDGVATVKEMIKQKMGIKPVLSYTTSTKMRLVEGLKAGAVDKIMKPFKRDDLVKHLTKVHLMKAGQGGGSMFGSSIRLAKPLPITFSKASLFAKKMDGRTLDISATGAKIQSTEMFPKGTALKILLDLPQHGRIKVQGKVINITHDKLHSTYELGVEFAKISDGDKEKLEMYVMDEASKV